jgi:hypothetical protein
MHNRHFIGISIKLMLLTIALSAFCAQPDTSGWVLDDEKDNIRIYTRTIPDLKNVEFKGVGLDSINIEIIAATLLDISGYSSWLSSVSESKIIKVIDPDHFFVYQRLKFTWPFRDRDIIASVDIDRDYARGILKAHLQGVHDTLVPSQEGCLRMTTMTGNIELQYIHRKVTEVSYSESFDPGGNFPEWLTKIVSKRMPVIVIATLKKVIRKKSGGLSAEGLAIKNEIEQALANGSLNP